MMYRHERGAVTWVDLEQPTAEELAATMREFDISERFETELALPSPLPIAASEGATALLVLHFPTHDEEDDVHEQEVDIVAGEHFVITVRYEVVPPLHALHKSLEARELLDLAPHLAADELLELLIGKIFDSVRDHAKHVAARLTKIERQMFAGKERDTVRDISLIHREFLHLESALADNEEPLAHFLAALEQRGFFGKSFTERAARISAERDHLARLVDTHRAVTAELQQTNGALLSATQNEIIKRLTVITFIILPLELVVNLFGFQFSDTPLTAGPDGFWIVLTMLAIIGLVLTLFFARKRWL